MTDEEPPEPELIAQKHRNETAFIARDLSGNRYRYVHFGNVERKRLAELIETHSRNLADHPEELQWWAHVHAQLGHDLDDL